MRKSVFIPIFMSFFSINAYSLEGGSLSNIEPAVGMSSRTPMTEGQCLRMSPGCTATLIAPNAVLTAAHCVNPANSYQFKACEYDEYGDPAFYVGSEVKEVIVHPEYLVPDASKPLPYNKRDYDIAIHILEEPVKRINPISILESPVNVGQEIVMFGYGFDAGLDNGFKRVGYNTVSSVFDYRFRTLHSSGAIIRSGDSGGPVLVYNDNGTPYVAGVNSIRSATWSGFVNIPAHSTWIKQVIESAQSEPVTQTVFLRSVFGTYFVNENNGGDNQTVNANRTLRRAWEEMTMVKLQNNTECLRHGDSVSIRSGNGTYWTATSIGELNVDSRSQGIASSFELINHTTPQGCLRNEDKISLRSNAFDRSYVVAEYDGYANVNRARIGPWEQFSVILKDAVGTQ